MDQVATTAKAIQEDMKGILQESMKLLVPTGGNTILQNQEVATMDLQHKSVDGMTKCYELICNLEKQLEKMKDNTDGSDSCDNESNKNNRTKALENALSAAYKKLEKFSA